MALESKVTLPLVGAQREALTKKEPDFNDDIPSELELFSEELVQGLSMTNTFRGSPNTRFSFEARYEGETGNKLTYSRMRDTSNLDHERADYGMQQYIIKSEKLELRLHNGASINVERGPRDSPYLMRTSSIEETYTSFEALKDRFGELACELVEEHPLSKKKDQGNSN